MPRLALLAALAALFLPATAAGGNTQLFASVGPGFTISLMDADAYRVTQLSPGTYDIVIDDQADEHSFHLKGPGIDRYTDVSFVGTATWTVTLTDGSYTFFCDPHASSLRGTFKVGTGDSGSTPPATTTKPSATKLTGTVGPGFRISLTDSKGKPVKTLKAGTYAVTVRDRSASHSFRLLGTGKATTVPFVGTMRWTVKLKKGTLAFFCEPHHDTMRGSVRVT
jgi:plastocyanin